MYTTLVFRSVQNSINTAARNDKQIPEAMFKPFSFEAGHGMLLPAFASLLGQIELCQPLAHVECKNCPFFK